MTARCRRWPAPCPTGAGGTRIGEAIKAFNYRWARRVLRGGAVVLVISDGWDRGDPDLLSREMARLQRSCHRLIWLNPLLGSPGYEPLTRGMQAALPYIDDFLPAHNLHSLQELALHLNRLTARRAPTTVRRSHPRIMRRLMRPEVVVPTMAERPPGHGASSTRRWPHFPAPAVGSPQHTGRGRLAGLAGAISLYRLARVAASAWGRSSYSGVGYHS